MENNFIIGDWNSEEEIGYTQITTFYQDFSIADYFGIKPIKDTFDKVFNDWKNNYKFLTELVLVLNKKCWYYYKLDKEFYELYQNLFYETKDYALENLKGDELRYFLDKTD